MKISNFMYLIIFLFISFNAFSDEIISNKNITINLAKDILVDMKHENSKKIKYDYSDNSWRYQLHSERSFVNNSQMQVDIQIPLIWYYERF